MPVSNRLGEQHNCSPSLYLLFVGRHGQPARGAEDLVAAFGSREEASAAFRQARLGMSNVEGWAELTRVTPGDRTRIVSWFGQDRVRNDRAPTWLVASDQAGPAAPASARRRPSLPRRLLRRP